MTTTLEENFVIQLNDIRFVGNKRYSEYQPLRNGPWGFMAKAIFSASKQPVTIHQVKNIFQKPTREITQLLHVLQRLRSLKGQQHILTVFDIYTDPPTAIPADGHIDHPHYGDSFIQDLYIVTRFVDTDFNVFLNSSLPLQDSDIQYCLFQLLRGAQNLHDTVHLSLGDINPSTILGQRSTNEFMYASFGIRDIAPTTQMRAIRSPERLYSESYPPSDYRPSDVWSIGCLFAALLSHSSSFFKGTTDRELLTDMVRKLGWVTYDHVVTWEFLRHGHSPAYADIMSILKEEEEFHDDVASPRFASYFPLSVNHDALDLLQQMLRPIPNTRIAIADALRHPYLQNYHNPFTDFHDPRRLDGQNVSPTDGSVVGGMSPVVSMKSPVANNGLPQMQRRLSGQGSPAHLLAPHLAKSASFRHHVMSVNMLDEESHLTLAQLQQLWYEEIAKYHRLFVQQQPAVTAAPLLHPVVVDPPIGSPPILTPVPHLDVHHQPSMSHIKTSPRANEAFPVIEDHSHVHGHNDFHLSDVAVTSHRDLLHQTHSFHNNQNVNNVRSPSHVPHQPQPLQPLPHLPLTSSDPPHHYHGQHSHRSYHVLSDQEAKTLEESKSLTAVPPEHYHLHHDHDHDHSRDGVCHIPHCHDHDHDHDHGHIHDYGEDKTTPHSGRYSSRSRHVSEDKYDANYLAKMYSSSSKKHVMFPDEKKQQLADAERDWVRHHLAESKATDASPVNDRHSFSSPSTYGQRVTLPSIHDHDHDYDYDHHDHDHIHSRLLLDEKKVDETKWEYTRSPSRKI